MSRLILIVDDDAQLRSCINRYLKSAGYETAAAEDGFAGEQIARSVRPDLILLDMRMPVRSGLATLQGLRDTGETRHIPVVMLSGCDDDLAVAAEAGADRVLLKPFHQRRLVETVAELLRTAAAPSERPVHRAIAPGASAP